MIVGVIQTKDLIRHPISVISIQGIWGFIRLLGKALSRKKYHFIDFLEITTRTFIGRRAKGR